MLTARIGQLGSLTQTSLADLGRFSTFVFLTLRALPGVVTNRRRLPLLMQQFFMVGTMSLPVVMLVGAFVGAVLGLETYEQFAVIGQEVRLGGVIHVAVVRQIGPVLASVMIAGRVGGAVAAEIGTMRVTEQIDALRVLGVNPVAYLASPRVLACLIMVPVLTVVSDLLGILGSYLVVVGGFGVDARSYWAFSARFILSYDVIIGLTKSFFFGLAIGLIASYKGFHCASGAAGVGRAATDAFVTSFIAIIILNFFLAKFMSDLGEVIGIENINALTG